MLILDKMNCNGIEIAIDVMVNRYSWECPVWCIFR